SRQSDPAEGIDEDDPAGGSDTGREVLDGATRSALRVQTATHLVDRHFRQARAQDALPLTGGRCAARLVVRERPGSARRRIPYPPASLAQHPPRAGGGRNEATRIARNRADRSGGNRARR